MICINMKGKLEIVMQVLTQDKMRSLCLHKQFNIKTTSLRFQYGSHLWKLPYIPVLVFPILFVIGKLQPECYKYNIFRIEIILNISLKTLQWGDKLCYWQYCKMGHQLKLKREEDLNNTKNIYIYISTTISSLTKDGLDIRMQGFSSVHVKQYVLSYVHIL